MARSMLSLALLIAESNGETPSSGSIISFTHSLRRLARFTKHSVERSFAEQRWNTRPLPQARTRCAHVCAPSRAARQPITLEAMQLYKPSPVNHSASFLRLAEWTAHPLHLFIL